MEVYGDGERIGGLMERCNEFQGNGGLRGLGGECSVMKVKWSLVEV